MAPCPSPQPHPRLLQQENEELRRRLASATRRTEALERELEIGQDCLELELGQSREELDKFKDKFRRCGNKGQISPHSWEVSWISLRSHLIFRNPGTVPDLLVGPEEQDLDQGFLPCILL